MRRHSATVHRPVRAPGTRLVVVAVFGIAGVFHFLTPHSFATVVPEWLPRTDVLVAVSGAAELAGAAGLVWARTRYWAGWGLIALLVAVFPANIQMLIAAQQSSAPMWWQIALWLRLPLQPVMIWLVWRSAEMSHR